MAAVVMDQEKLKALAAELAINSASWAVIFALFLRLLSSLITPQRDLFWLFMYSFSINILIGNFLLQYTAIVPISYL